MRRPARSVLVAACVLAGSATAAVGGGAPAHAAAQQCTADHAQLVRDRPSALARLGAQRAWGRATGRGVVVAVVDSGVAARNEHLRASVLPGVSLLPGDPDPRGWTDSTGHGTAVAGTVAARPVAGSGVVGLALDAQVLPVRVYDAEDDQARERGWAPSPGRTADGIRAAADRGARIIAVPLSQPDPDPRLDAAVAYAVQRGALVVAGAGSRRTPDAPADGVRYPAASPGALGVAAADRTDSPAGNAVRGRQVGVLAPGSDVLTTWLDQGDCLLADGAESSSWATGYAAAAAALLAQAYPGISPADIAYRLEASASRTHPARRDDAHGWGLVQPLEALTLTPDPTRPGPALPGHPAAPGAEAPEQVVRVQARSDHDAPVRGRAVMWLLLGAVLVVLALLAALAARSHREAE